MKYNQIQALVPATEHFDETAIVNEGGYLSTGHLAVIEDALTQHASAVDAVQVLLDTANAGITERDAAIETHTATIATMNTVASANATTIQTQAEKITALEAQVVELGGKASGSGSTLATKEDEVPAKETSVSASGTKIYAWDDPEHPANKSAGRALNFAKK